LPVSTQAPLVINGFIKVSEVRVTRDVTQYTYRATLVNGGAALRGATATATSVSPNTVVVDGQLSFGPVGPGGSVVSTDTFVFRHNRTFPFAWTNLQWTVVGTAANSPPVANAGPDQPAALGQTITRAPATSRSRSMGSAALARSEW